MSIELEPERMAKRFYEASQRLAPAYNQPVPPAWSDLPSEQRIFLSVVGGAVLSQLEEEKAQVSHSRSVVLLGSEFTDFNLCYLAEEEARRNGGPAEKGAADGRRV